MMSTYRSSHLQRRSRIMWYLEMLVEIRDENQHVECTMADLSHIKQRDREKWSIGMFFQQVCQHYTPLPCKV